jgi:uncharacterized membrane protein YgdD (TMEM256/DUF423 family)
MRVLAVISVVFAAACANGGPPPPDPTSAAAYPDVNSFCEAYGQAQCSQVVISACGVKDASMCAAAAAQACLADQPQGTTYVSAHAPACIALVTSTYTSTTLTKDQLAALATTCGTQMFSGPGEARSTCQSDYDCSSSDGLSCVVPFGQTAGKCYVPTPSQPGAACGQESDVCPDGFYCSPMSQACTADAAANVGCSPGFNQCADGLTCSGAGPFATCTAASPDGYPCGVDTDCVGGMCDKAASQSQGTCASQITLSPLDASCASFIGTGT